MGIAESMKGLTEDILASYDTRVKALGDLVADTHKIVADARKTIKGFASDRKKMSVEQAEALGNYAKDLAKNVSGLLKEFGKNRKHMSEAQVKSLTDFVKGITDFVKDLTKKTGSMLNGFSKDRKEMSEELKDKLTKDVKGIQVAVKNIVNDAQALVTEYRSDMIKARSTWQGMADTLAKAKGKGVMAKIETGEKAAIVPAEEAKKKGRGKKRGRKKGRK